MPRNQVVIADNSNNASISGNFTAASLIRSGGTAAQILAANGSVITAGTNITISGGSISATSGTSLNGTGFVRMSGTTVSYITGTSSQFVKADGSVDSNTYVTGGPYLPLAGGTLTGKVTFPSAVADRPQMPGGILGLNTGDGNFDIWGISTEYYPSHPTGSNAWGIQWNGDNNQVRFIGASAQRLVIDLDGGNSGLTWEGNTVWHAGNLTNLNQLTNGPGYITSYTETDTLASVTGRGASTNTFVSLLGGSRIVVQNSTDGGNNRGIFMWNTSDTNWGIYMSTAGASKSLANGTAPTGIDGSNSHHIRFRIAGSSGNGFIWENNSEQTLMSVRGDNGNLYVRGQIYAGNSTTNQVWHSGNLTNLNQLTNGPGYITSYTETDTLATVTSRGNTTSTSISASGFISSGNRRLSMGILDLNSGSTPTQFKIKTTIPWNSGAADFTVNIKGFRYGASQMVSLSIGWHHYLNTFYNEVAICNGGWAPTITLAKSPDNFVIIHLAGPSYWPKMYVESVYTSAYTDSYSSGWTWSDADLSDCTDISVVPYNTLATSISGNSVTTSQTNFSSLTINSAAVATQSWVQSQGYLSGTVAVANGGTGATTRKAASTSIANFGQLENHGTYTDANSVQQWGGTFIQGSTNTPNFNGSTQHYQMMLSLGADYEWGSGNTYAAQIAFARNVSTPYIGIRYKEGGANTAGWAAWQKISAGYADSAGSANSVAWSNVTGRPTALSSFSNDTGYITQANALQPIAGNSGAYDLSTSGQHAWIRFSQGTWLNPPTSGNYSHVLSFNMASDNRTVQIYLGDVPGYLWWRPNQGGTWHPWERILTSNNYNSWAPSLTGSGASGTWSININGNSATTSQTNFSSLSVNSNTVLHASNWSSYAAPRAYVTDSFVDFTIYGNQNTYYPVTIQNYNGAFSWARYTIHRGYSDNAPWNPIGTGVHQGGLTFSFEWAGDIAWGGNDKSIRVLEFDEVYTNMVAGMQLAHCEGVVVWLRGGGAGGAYYRLHGPGGRSQGFTVNMSTWTSCAGVTYASRTYDSGVVNSEIRSRYPIRGSASGDIYVNNNIVLHAGNFNSYSPTLTGGGASGTWAINVTGNAATATTASGVAWSNVSSKPAGWLNSSVLIEDIAPGATAFPSGFYQSYQGTGNPTGTWFNYINVRHSNSGNGHGYQLGMSYYDNNLWFRSYQGSTSPTFGPWCRAISSIGGTIDSGNLLITGGYNLGINNSTPQYRLDVYQGSGIAASFGGTFSPGQYGGIYFGYVESGNTSYRKSALVFERTDNNNQGGNASGKIHFLLANYSSVSVTSLSDAVLTIDSDGNGSSGSVRMGVGERNPSYPLQVSKSISSISIYASGDIVAYSDRSVKGDVRKIEDAINKVLKLNGYTYMRTDLNDKSRRAGVIAQEVEEVLPEVVAVNPDGTKAVAYGNLTSLLIEAIKEQQKQIEELKAKLDGLTK